MKDNVAGIPGYHVTRSGEVWSRRNVGRSANRLGNEWKILRPAFTRTGYAMVNLPWEGKYRNHYIHRLVLETYVGPCPDEMQACHKNGNPLDNRLENLRWDSHSNNQRDMVNHGNSGKGSKNVNSKLTENDVKAIRIALENGAMPTRIAKSFGITYGQIWNISRGLRWTHI